MNLAPTPLSTESTTFMGYSIVDGRVQTRSLEAHIVDHCNLQCWGCCSMSPYLPKWTIDPADLEMDLRRARYGIAPRQFKLVGGEPLLHPRIDECLAIARRSQIAPVVSVTTNGLLLGRVSERFWELVQALTISLYPEPALPADLVALIERKAAEHGIPINWKKQDSFVEMDLDAPREDATLTQQVYASCWLRRRCHIVSKGRFFACTRPPHFETLYKDPVFLGDGIELEERPEMADRLVEYLRRSEPLLACAMCQGGNAPSRPHRQMSGAEIRSNLSRFVGAESNLAESLRPG